MKRGIKIFIGIIIIILLLILVLIEVYINTDVVLKIDNALNLIIKGNPDTSCKIDSDCKIKAATCGCNCGKATNKNWNRFCPFPTFSARSCDCFLDPKYMKPKCIDNKCEIEYTGKLSGLNPPLK